MPQTVTVSRTMLLALLGYIALCVAGIVDAIALFWCLAHPDTLGAYVSQSMTTAAVIVGAIATVTTGGAIAHGARHLGAAEPSGGMEP